MRMPCLKIVACTVPEKTVTQIYTEKIENGQIKGRIKAKNPILKSTIQQPIVHINTKFQDSSFNSS